MGPDKFEPFLFKVADRSMYACARVDARVDARMHVHIHTIDENNSLCPKLPLPHSKRFYHEPAPNFPTVTDAKLAQPSD